MIGAYRALAGTLYWSGDFESARQHAMCGVQIWRSGGVQPRVQDVSSPAVVCLYYVALSEWHLGEIASSDATMLEAISLAKTLNDMPSLALALYHAAYLAHYQRLAAVERLASDLIELSTRQKLCVFSGWWRGSPRLGAQCFRRYPWRHLSGSRMEWQAFAVPRGSPVHFC